MVNGQQAPKALPAAAGQGKRAKGDLDELFFSLLDMPIVLHGTEAH